MTEIHPVKLPRLYMQVAEQLQGLIAQGEFKPGERLPSERDLASQLAVSRPTIREAMIALEIADLVEVRSGSGVYVLNPTQKLGPLGNDPGPFEILEARRVIESETSALAAQRISEEQLQKLFSLLSDMASENQQEHAAERADEQFHRLIAEAAANSALSAAIAWLWALRNESEISARFHQRVRQEGIRPIVADHQAIFDALQQRDPNGARQAMERHLQRVIDQLLEE